MEFPRDGKHKFASPPPVEIHLEHSGDLAGNASREHHLARMGREEGIRRRHAASDEEKQLAESTTNEFREPHPHGL